MADPKSPRSSDLTLEKNREIRSGDFTYNIDGQNKFRPYFIGVEDYDPNVASIVLVKNPSRSSTTMFNSSNFFSKLKNRLVDSTSINDVLNTQQENKEGYLIPTLPDIGGYNYLAVFKNFSLTDYNESSEERIQLIKTFGKDWVGFLHGENPKVYSYTGAFLDYKNYPYYEEFMSAYNKYLRGTLCVKNRMQMYLSYDYKIVRGYILGINVSKSAGGGAPNGMLGFSFKVLIQKEDFVRPSVNGQSAMADNSDRVIYT